MTAVQTKCSPNEGSHVINNLMKGRSLLELITSVQGIHGVNHCYLLLLQIMSVYFLRIGRENI